MCDACIDCIGLRQLIEVLPRKARCIYEEQNNPFFLAMLHSGSKYLSFVILSFVIHTSII